MASIILPPGSAPANPSEGEIYYDNSAKQVKFRDNAGFKGLGGADLQGEPHIITKKLHPAYLGKLLDDTTSHSGDYGTEQADGRMYYYTEIAGSKPIHDPRIGAHFGSQRYKFKSLQLLEQETATSGVEVHSIDGREWMRTSGKLGGSSDPVYYRNDSNGVVVQFYRNGTGFIELTGYFNDANFIHHTGNGRGFQYHLDGGSASATLGETTVNTPLVGRYVDGGSVSNLGISTTLGIHTLKIRCSTADDLLTYGIELIAQDTTSSSTKVKIQVPAQDVVSYGRKFSVSATAQHYDPFNGFSSGDATALEAKVDTATSLGLAKWLHSSTYYRPYNGMRVVKWIDENGAIKTSVTCMPPNAKSFADSSLLSNANAKANASIANNTFYPTFEAHTTSVNEDNLHEVAKTFNFREFGNGAANEGSNTSANWQDSSMLSGNDSIAYCMDDGLTTLSAHRVEIAGSQTANAFGHVFGYSDSTQYVTFIGTGFQFRSKTSSGDVVHDIAQNLPYGTHVFEQLATTGYPIKVDGVALGNHRPNNNNTDSAIWEISIYQPKRPPIPDSACVLADYMVFADFKPQTTAGFGLISKGVRKQNISRDVFCDETDGDSFTFNIDVTESDGGFLLRLSGNADSDTSMKLRIPSFGTNYVHRGHQSDTRTKLFIGDTDNDSNATKDNTANSGSYAHLTSDLTLGVHQFGSNAASGQNGHTGAFDIVTPIHTSFHYQPFETLFLHELIGGDRSMEQINLICSSDGKSWDEITRDTSYMGFEMFRASTDTGKTGASDITSFDELRGSREDNDFGNKNFAIAYDRYICLRDGQYEIQAATMRNGAVTYMGNILVNGTLRKTAHSTNINHDSVTNVLCCHLKRGDYIQVGGQWYGAFNYSHFNIKRMET